jgi:hypothetical protein
MEVLRYLSWDIAALMLALVLAGLALRRWAGRAGARIGNAMVWLSLAMTAGWAGFNLYRAMTIVLR